ncbi:EamA/RhaT family transporter [Flavobacterium sp. SM15]|uniref:EamA/RhaT family transporter n=1 Tax=Flavobacterium sp. SM15 TaxID=2908005 RepID=UPI001EDBAE6C|nr:EamA/RhaT family transporter [Flavobacterium sp. SM15]MCG2611675.1 EamA/RhaT family transporter [Flavobacterium sp. SM15]
MMYLILSILCSVSVAVLLKYAKRFPIAIEQIVAANYVIALICCFFIFSPDIKIFSNAAPWKIYIPLWILLPTIFLFLAASIKHFGIVKTDIAQRLSLFIPILASYFIFKETIGVLKLIGLLLGFTAIFFTLAKKETKKTNSANWLYPSIVFIGFGVIDILFKQIAATKEIPFTTSLFTVFSGAFIIALSITLFYIIKGKSKFSLMNIRWGILLGFLNFGNIFFYLKAHQAFSENPSTVFAGMNFGVIVLGSFIGVIAFEEKLSKINYIGIALALTAVVIITLSQLYIN